MIADRASAAAADSMDGELARIAELRRLGILDKPPEPAFDRLVQLVARLLDVPIALVSLIDERRQWVFARAGIDVVETARDVAFCDYTIRSDEVLVVSDALTDARFRENPFVTGDPRIRFYAGAPLCVAGGQRIGSLCVIDRRPRTLSETQVALLQEFASFIVQHLEERVRFIEAEGSRGQLLSILDASPFAVVVVDRDATVLHWNRAAEQLFGYTADEVKGRFPPSVPPEEVGRFMQFVAGIYAGESFWDITAERVRKDGRRMTISVCGGPVYRADGTVVGATCIVRDVTESRRHAEIDRRRYEILELAANGADLAVVVERAIQCLEFGLPGALGSVMLRDGDVLRPALVGCRLSSEWLSEIAEVAIAPDAAGSCGAAAYENAAVITEEIATDPRWAVYRRDAARAGLAACWSSPIPSAKNRSRVLGTIAAYFTEPAAPTDEQVRFLAETAHLMAIAIESERARTELEDAATHDPLTGLLNRNAFDERFAAALARARLDGTKVALGLVDLDGFKAINDLHGHAVGDLLLREVAHRLRSAMPGADPVARVGGDEFLFCLTGFVDRGSLERSIERVRAALAPAFRPGGHEIDVAGSIGVALFPDDASEPSQLYRLADRAMYVSKVGRTGVTFHGLTRTESSSAALARDLAGAIDRDELVLHYLPKISLVDGSLIGVESLLRWRHPARGLLQPADFLSIIEESGLAIPIGAWVLRESARTARRFAEASRPVPVSANVSARQFEDPGFLVSIGTAIAEAGIAPDRLYVEITEALIMRSPIATAATLRDIAEIGARTVIDDFGTGYSSLSQLRNLAVSGVKIHPSFVHDIDAPHSARAARGFAGAIASFTERLGVEAVAEGIETAVQARELRAAGCRQGQGHYFAAAMPLEQMLRWNLPDGMLPFG